MTTLSGTNPTLTNNTFSAGVTINASATNSDENNIHSGNTLTAQLMRMQMAITLITTASTTP